MTKQDNEIMKGFKNPMTASFLLFLMALFLITCDRNSDSIDPTGLTGVYTCQESSVHSGVRKYFIEIDKVKDAEDLYIISNFHNLGENDFIYAGYIRDTLWIDNQILGGVKIDGEGPVEGNFRSIFLYYETDDGVTVLDFYANYTR